MPSKPLLVTDTGPLLALVAALEDFGVLGRVATLVVPGEVLAELQAGGARDRSVQIIQGAHCCRFLPVFPTLPTALISALGLGEASVIHAALIEAIPTVVIDERKGRRWAAMNGLHVTGSLGVLLALHRRGWVVSIAQSVARMKAKGIHLSESLVDETIKLAGEKP